MSIPATKLIVGPTIDKGIRTDRKAFAIDNDAFPKLVNAYQWRGRILRKRGTSLLTRLRRFFNSLSPSYSSIPTITLGPTGVGNLLTGFGLQSTGNIIPGTVTITIGGNSYTDPAMDGTLSPSGTIVYSTGVITILAEANNAASAVFFYYPSLPVMGLEDFELDSDQYPRTIGFDTVYSYQITQSPIVATPPFLSYDVSFYKNPGAIASLPAYVPKTNPTPTTWNGEIYQQFWTTNYQNAMWTTNGISVPFSVTHIGMQFAPAVDIAYVSNTATTIDVTIAGSPLVVGDWVFFNEWTGANAATLNFQTGFVTAAVAPNYTITLPNAALGAGPYTPGIIQYLTNRSDVTKDTLRWYDGDPTNGSATAPILSGNKGWVNFAPPLSQSNYSIANLPLAIYYLVGARVITQYKNRLCFFGPVVQTSIGNPIYLQDVVVYSNDGTPYYTASFKGDVQFPTSIQSLLVPDNQSAFPPAYFEDSTGFGGFVSAGLDEPITTVESNEDALIVGFPHFQTRFVFTGNDIVPFDFYLINSELGSSSTFSSINMDRGVITRGPRGYIISSQTEVRRIDLDIPDNVFQNRMIGNGAEKVTAQRDYINEWIYFTYPSNQNKAIRYRFNTQTLQYNYRDESWGIFNECYTTYGQFIKIGGYTWRNIGEVYPTWKAWNTAWNSGSTTLEQPIVIGGNQQGFVLTRAEGTGEGKSLYIQNIVGNVITSPDHSLNGDDFIIIYDCIGTVSTQVNGKVFSVKVTGVDTFELNPPISAATYFGGGTIVRMYVPLIQTKQFPVAWGDGRKTRIGVQRYLLTKTANAQITLLLFLSQDGEGPYNIGNLVPGVNVVNSSLIYSTLLYTCPESTNIGLTPANVNLMMPTAESQSQIWHRMNTSLIGDTVQVGFTLSDAQMRNENLQYQFAEIELHSMIIDVTPSQMLV